jgi:threonine dehydratase
VIALERIRAAALLAGPHVRRTPTLALEGERWLKLECLQPTGSFKVRGFFAAALGLPADDLRRGLLTVSAGNAAQACAYVARTLGVPCRVVTFDTAPATKVEGIRRWGAEPVFLPRAELLDWMARRGWESERETFVHPFASEEVAAGHGGLGLELLEDVPGLARVLVPVGGGGLALGVASALKGARPEVEVVGVQSDGYPSWVRTLELGAPARLDPATIADGTSAPVEPAMVERLAPLVDRWLLVPEPRLRSAVAELATSAKVVAEGAGALAWAGLEQLSPGVPTAAVISGGNVDRALLAELLASL